MTKKVSKDLIWAEEMLLVYQNLGMVCDDKVLTTPSARRIHRWIDEDDKNETKFIADIVPKATAIIEKNAPKDVSDAVVEIDRKTVGELQEFLISAVEDSAVSKSHGTGLSQ